MFVLTYINTSTQRCWLHFYHVLEVLTFTWVEIDTTFLFHIKRTVPS